MLKKSKEMVIYTSPSEVIIGPLSTEVDLIENCFTLAGRSLKDFKREVHPMRDTGDMLKIANEVISASREEIPQ
jgi:hypothetical protein